MRHIAQLCSLACALLLAACGGSTPADDAAEELRSPLPASASPGSALSELAEPGSAAS